MSWFSIPDSRVAQRTVFTALTLVLLAWPGSAAAQGGWDVNVGILLARDLRHERGPDLGAIGAEVQVHAPSSGAWTWGGALAWHRFGRFQSPFYPDAYSDHSAILAGARVRRDRVLTPGLYSVFGLDLVLGMQDPSDADVSRDPGVGGRVGLGVRSPRPAPARPFAELALNGIAVSGEYTDVGAVYLTLMAGLSF
jgi:hypothetical protein